MNEYKKITYILFILSLFNICVESQNHYFDINYILKSTFGFNFMRNYGTAKKDNKYFKYRDYDNIIDYLDNLKLKYSEVLELSKTKSRTGLKCGNEECLYLQVKLGMKINDNTENELNIPNILILSGMHGDEKIGVAISIGLIESIINEYSKGNISVIHLLETRRIWIVPIVNPWGYYHNKRTERDNDVNRDFPSNSGRNCLMSESSKIIYDLYNNHSFIFAATLHSGLKSISYGKGNRDINDKKSIQEMNKNIEEEKIMELIGKELQLSAGKILNNGLLDNYYKTLGNIDKVVYSVNGSFEDWSLIGYGNEWNNGDYVKCNELIGNNDKANKGGTLTYLIEIDENKNPPEDTLGLIDDVFKMIDLDKIAVQPSHVTRNVRMLIKLIEHSKSEILFLSKPPNTLYYGQTFRLNFSVVGCYSFSNLVFKLKDKYNKELKLEFIMERKNNSNNNNSIITEVHNTIYYQRCSSIFINNQQLQEQLKIDNHLNSKLYDKNECSESNLLTKIVNRSFRVKNKCKSFYQYSRYKPISLLVKIPTEDVIVNTFNRNFEDFLFTSEIEFDRELHNIVYDLNYIDNNNNNNSNVNGKYGYYWKFFESKINLNNNTLKQETNKFSIKLSKPQDILQIKFTNCNRELSDKNNSFNEWSTICNLFLELVNYYKNEQKTANIDNININKHDDDKKRLYRNLISDYINNIKLGFGDDYILKNNLEIINNNYDKYLIGSIYILPSDPRTSSLSINLSGIDKYNKLNDTSHILTEIQDSSIMLPYFGNVTLELSLKVSSEKSPKGEYYLLMFSQFVKLLGRDLFKYNYLNDIIYSDNKFKDYIGVFSLIDNQNINSNENSYSDNNNSIIKYINIEKVMEIISESRYQKYNLLELNDKKLSIDQLNDILRDYFVIICFNKHKNNTSISIAIGKIHFDSYLKFSSQNNYYNEYYNKSSIERNEKRRAIEITGVVNKNINNHSKNKTKVYNNIRNTLSKWWENDSNSYINIRLVFIFTLILFIILPILHFILVFFRKKCKYSYINSMKSNSKTLIIDMHTPQSLSNDEDCYDYRNNINKNNYNRSNSNILDTHVKINSSKTSSEMLNIGNIIGWRKKKKYDSPEIYNSPRVSPSKSISLPRIRGYSDNTIDNDEFYKTFEFMSDKDRYIYGHNHNDGINSYSTLQQRVNTGNYNNINNFFNRFSSSYSLINNNFVNNNNDTFSTYECVNKYSQCDNLNKTNIKLRTEY
ncbi:hypothetical protein RS030_101600 [Cryptosporidium xiaoi]|uniref:Peptidase M14 domain-containing protein n=1 Tax=Cryptosporidium xiaoi TaxID=659607 RepID=A0AAV9Y2S9_9CRYT